MTVELLRRYFNNLAEFVRDVGGQSPTVDELHQVSSALEPFDKVTVEGLGQLLAYADEYHRSEKIDPPTTTVAELNDHIRRIEVKLKTAKGRLPEMKRLERAQTAATKPRKNTAKAATSAEPDEITRHAADSIKKLTERAKASEVSDEVIDAEIAELNKLNKNQLYHVARLINATAGLTGRSGAKAIIARITERLQGVKDAYDRADK